MLIAFFALSMASNHIAEVRLQEQSEKRLAALLVLLFMRLMMPGHLQENDLPARSDFAFSSAPASLRADAA